MLGHLEEVVRGGEHVLVRPGLERRARARPCSPRPRSARPKTRSSTAASSRHAALAPALPRATSARTSSTPRRSGSPGTRPRAPATTSLRTWALRESSRGTRAPRRCAAPLARAAAAARASSSPSNALQQPEQRHRPRGRDATPPSGMRRRGEQRADGLLRLGREPRVLARAATAASCVPPAPWSGRRTTTHDGGARSARGRPPVGTPVARAAQDASAAAHLDGMAGTRARAPRARAGPAAARSPRSGASAPATSAKRLRRAARAPRARARLARAAPRAPRAAGRRAPSGSLFTSGAGASKGAGPEAAAACAPSGVALDAVRSAPEVDGAGRGERPLLVVGGAERVDARAARRRAARARPAWASASGIRSSPRARAPAQRDPRVPHALGHDGERDVHVRRARGRARRAREHVLHRRRDVLQHALEQRHGLVRSEDMPTASPR